MAYYKLGEQFQWFVGRVVNITDDEYRLGRVQIRIIDSQTGENLGKGSGSKGIEDEQLLWAWPVSAIQSASLHQAKLKEIEQFAVPEWIGAVGLSPTGIAKGTYVFGFYLDGMEKNIPLIFGTYHKKSVLPEKDSEGGTLLQTKETPPIERQEWDVAPLAQGDFTDPQGKEVKGQTLPKEPYKKTEFKRNKKANEPESAYKAQYPYNTTYTTKSGHAIELDDTPGYERIHMWHKSGSYEEIANGDDFEGRRVKRTKGDDQSIVDGDNTKIVSGEEWNEIKGNAYTTVLKNNSLHVAASSTEVVGAGKTTVVRKDNTTVVSGGNFVVSITENDGDGGDALITTSGNVKINATGGITLQGPVTIQGHLSVTGGISDKTGVTGAASFPSGRIMIVKNGIVKSLNG